MCMHIFQGQRATVFGLQQKYIFSLIYNKICLTNTRKKMSQEFHTMEKEFPDPELPLAPHPTALTDTSNKFCSH